MSEKSANQAQVKRNPFTAEQDEMLKEFVRSSTGKPKWRIIAQKIGKESRSCRERYKNYLDPALSNAKWTPEEDEKLKNLVNENGKHWASFRSYFPGRSSNDIKNRYNCHINKIRKSKKASTSDNTPPIPSNITEANTLNTLPIFDDEIYNTFFGEFHSD